jgi:hypothetical protein
MSDKKEGGSTVQLIVGIDIHTYMIASDTYDDKEMWVIDYRCDSVSGVMIIIMLMIVKIYNDMGERK